jgi:hypothetical protein
MGVLCMCETEWSMNSDENFRKVSVKIPESFRKVSVNFSVFLHIYEAYFMKHI